MTVTISELEARFASIPNVLRETLAVSLPEGEFWRDARDGFDVVGVGASEMPARLLVNLLVTSGMRARFVPISSFAGEGPSSDLVKTQTLVVYSQGLSPNARMALAHGARYRRSILFTSVAEDDPTECGETRR